MIYLAIFEGGKSFSARSTGELGTEVGISSAKGLGVFWVGQLTVVY
jgi:hypothetical protein